MGEWVESYRSHRLSKGAVYELEYSGGGLLSGDVEVAEFVVSKRPDLTVRRTWADITGDVHMEVLPGRTGPTVEVVPEILEVPLSDDILRNPISTIGNFFDRWAILELRRLRLIGYASEEERQREERREEERTEQVGEGSVRDLVGNTLDAVRSTGSLVTIAALVALLALMFSAFGGRR